MKTPPDVCESGQLAKHRRRVLLVDADGDSEQIIEKAAALTGHSVTMVRTSRDAFAILSAKMARLDIVIVDVDPGAHGLALMEAVNSCADRPPIIAITALERAYMNPIARGHGAASCLAKPFTVREMAAALRAAIKPSPTSDQWGCLVPEKPIPATDTSEVCRGIAAKLRPFGSAR